MKIQLRITTKDIRVGKTRNGYECPVARALQRAIPNATDIHAGGIWLKFRIDKRYHELDTPKEVSAWMARFDRDDEVKPFRITIDEMERIWGM